MKESLFSEENTGEELRRLRLENKKLARQLMLAQNMIDRVRISSRTTASLSAVIAEEHLNQDLLLNLILKNSPNIIIAFDENGRVAYCTDSFLEKTGIASFGLVSGRSFPSVFKDFLSPGDIAHLRSLIARAMTEQRNVSLDKIIDFSGNDSRSYAVYITPMINTGGGTVGTMAIFSDMTDFLQAQQSEAASKAKSAFLATMSHEIRTPLNAIIGLSEIELQHKPKGETRRNLETIYNSGSSLLAIVNDILDISKIESGNLELDSHDYRVPSFINDVTQLNVVRIGSKKISFELSVDETIPVCLYGDELRIKQILNNLLSNAFKYTNSGKVTFRTEWEWQDSDALLIFTVSDTGRGIKALDAERLFTEYAQFDVQANRHIEGTGLGLAITKKLVDLMNGVIYLESEYGKGSTFTVKLRQKIIDGTPIGKEAVSALASFRFMEDRRVRSRNLIRSYMPYGSVLIVDDVPANLDVMKGLMIPYGLKMDFAGSGAEALDKIRDAKVKYDIVFMDHMMPGMDGIEATRIIRQEIGTEYAKNLPVVALTANAIAGNKEMFLENGFNDFLPKPVDIMRLDTILNQWIRVRRKEDFFVNGGLKTGIRAGKAKRKAPPVFPKALEKINPKGVDLAAGLDRYSDEASYLTVLRSFVSHIPEMLSVLRGLILKENLSERAILFHGIKGAAYGICAMEVGRCAEAMEKAAKAGDAEALRTGEEEFFKLMEATVADLGAFIKIAGEGLEQTAIKRRPAPDTALLSRLRDAAGRFRTSQMEDIMDELMGSEYEKGSEMITWLKERVESLDYEAIQERLEKL